MAFAANPEAAACMQQADCNHQMLCSQLTGQSPHVDEATGNACAINDELMRRKSPPHMLLRSPDCQRLRSLNLPHEQRAIRAHDGPNCTEGVVGVGEQTELQAERLDCQEQDGLQCIAARGVLGDVCHELGLAQPGEGCVILGRGLVGCTCRGCTRLSALGQGAAVQALDVRNVHGSVAETCFAAE